MAAWTRLVWDQTLWMAANGPENCHVEHNPLNIHCPKGDKSFFRLLGNILVQYTFNVSLNRLFAYFDIFLRFK